MKYSALQPQPVFSRRIRFGAPLIVAIACCFLRQHQAMADATASSASLTASELQATAALQVKVSFTAKRQPLLELLAELQNKSGVTLTAAADAPAVRVTAFVNDLSLSEVMTALTRLYGIKWSRDNAGTYTLHASGLGELEQTLLKVGDMDTAGYRLWKGERQKASNVTQAVMRSADNNALAGPGGVAFEALPAEVQAALRRHMEARMAIAVVRAQQYAFESFLEQYMLHAASPELMPRKPGDTNPPIIARQAEMTVRPPGTAVMPVRLPFLKPAPLMRVVKDGTVTITQETKPVPGQ